MEISSRYHRLLTYDVKRNSEIDSIGPFKVSAGHFIKSSCTVKYKFAYIFMLIFSGKCIHQTYWKIPETG